MTHNLLLNYGLYRKMEIYRPHKATAEEMTKFHSKEYVKFLRKLNADNSKHSSAENQKFNVGEYTDCPVWPGLFEFTQIYSGASIDGAVKLNHGLTDIAVNWSGGLHHAKKGEASGFCYINDIVLAILELLKYHPRVLYIDIDIHHGDGVEEAFYVTDRVMTVSFHKFGDFFPGTGDIDDIGVKTGKYYSVNFPLQEGIDDKNYEKVFKPVISKVMETYRPTAVVLQCGADSLTGDRLGCFNLTLKGHAECVEFVKEFGLPTLVLGGGGYTIRNVARAWVYETSVLLNTEVSNNIPYNEFFEYYGPDFNLHLTPNPTMENMNSKDYIEKYKTQIFKNLKQLTGAPSVQFQDVPPDYMVAEVDEDAKDPNTRSDSHPDGQREHDAELYDNAKDQDQIDASGNRNKESSTGEEVNERIDMEID